MRRRSATLTKKPEEVEDSCETKATQETENVDKNVKIYLRRANKTTKIVNVSNKITPQKIFGIVEKELDISRNTQVLFFKGVRISLSINPQSPSQILCFEDKDILHVHNSTVVPKPEFTVSLEYLSQQNVKFKEVACIMKASESIETALAKAMNETIEEIRSATFIQSGRKLTVGKKPQDEFIEEGSIITVINRKNQFSKKIISEELESILSCAVPQKRKPIRHSISLEEGLQGLPDFKKKGKMMCLYKSSQMPETKEVIWESDSSTELNKRELIKNLYRKKIIQEQIKKEMASNSSESSSSGPNTFTLTDKLELKQEIKRLFQSDCLHNPTQLKKLEPPKFSNDCFIEDAEELEIDDEEKTPKSRSNSDSDSSQQKDEFDSRAKPGINLKGSFGGAKQLYSSLPLDLRKSIGKTKGSFTPVPLIPTRDFDDDNEMDI